MIPVADLTDEQQAIVRHTEGPALVFAVAGAGKTTSMVHRIRYLVKGRGVAADRILASSFSRSTVSDVEAALEAVDVPGVDVRTLHSLGYRLLRAAEDAGHLPARTQRQEERPDVLGQILASRALTHLAVHRSIDTYELGIDPDDLTGQIAAWKQQLAYADLDAASLPPDAREHATQAAHDNEDYLTLYRIYEDMRRQEGWITFDDMLLEGWEALMRFDDVRAQAQGDYDHVVVDEFQDVSRVQARMLDVLTAPHRNYMAIGDDDQCIYEWRGANPSFILDFRTTYDADEYLITDTFRSTLSQVALANAVIAQNENRRAKRLHLTRSAPGTTELRAADGPHDEAADLVDTVERLLDGGRTARDLVILVRTYAQTPFIEHVLIDRDLPYRIVGHAPFYRRREVKTLLQYLYWAVLERRIDRDGWFDRRRDAARYVDRFERILKRPNRYVKHDLIRRVTREAMQRQTSVLDPLVAALPDMHDRTADRVGAFLDLCEELVSRMDAPAKRTLDWLIDALDYETHLRERSAIAEVGEARVRTARALVRFAEGHPTAESLLDEIVRLSFGHPDGEPDRGSDDDAWLEIRSIHRAKGAEWPVVFVPGCNDGILPQRATRPDEIRPDPNGATAPDAGGGSDDAEDGGPMSFDAYLDAVNASEQTLPQAVREEERRLLYVAVTRARERLILSYDRHHAVSPFLREADAEERLETCHRVQTAFQALQTASGDLSDADVAALCAGVSTLGLERYVRNWWDAGAEARRRLRERLDALAPRVDAAKAAMEQYADRLTAHEEAVAALHAQRAAPPPGAAEAGDVVGDAGIGVGGAGEWGDLVRRVGRAGIPIANERPDVFFPDDATFRFEARDDATIVARWDGERVGVVDAFRSSRLTPEVVLSMPWAAVVARFERVGRGRDTVFATVDWTRTLRNARADRNGGGESAEAGDGEVGDGDDVASAPESSQTALSDAAPSASVPPEPDAPDALTQTLASEACAEGMRLLREACTA